MPNPVYRCKFDAGQIVTEQPEPSGDVMVEVRGEAKRYVMDELKLVPATWACPRFSSNQT